MEEELLSTPESKGTQGKEAQPRIDKPPRRGRRLLIIFLTLVLFAIFAGGLLWIFTLGSASPVGFGWFVFAFAAGLSMIVLPCTLPLAFVIVPLSMGKGYARGIATALSFGIGVAIMLSIYGILAAVVIYHCVFE